jgi:hypothetical protein
MEERGEKILLSFVSVLGTEMKRLNKGKRRNNPVVTAAIIAIVVGTTTTLAQQQAYAFVKQSDWEVKAPVVISGDNIYVAWWTNNTENGNHEVMFRASNDGGATFGDKMNLSNTPNADSGRVEIAGEGATVMVTWWEINQTSDTPVARMSTDGGETFGPLLMLGTNDTLTSTEEGGDGGAEGGGETTTEEEAVGGAEVAE